jgi:hypothetical protein
MPQNRVHIQSAITEEKHPDLYAWWTTTKDERSEVVRVALRRHLRESSRLETISKQLDRVERTLERCLKLLEGEQ